MMDPIPIVIDWAEKLAHPYSRYGLAIATEFHTDGKPKTELTVDDLRLSLTFAIEEGLEHFRMETKDDPSNAPELRFQPIALKQLRIRADLVSGNLAAQGKYLFPSVITADKQAKRTFVDAETILASLREKNIPLNKQTELKRSFAPIAGEINNGSKEKTNQMTTLFEAACATVSTLTFDKPSALMARFNTGIFPDLGFIELCEFVSTFHRFQSEGNNRMVGKPSKDGKYRRPPLCDGNYPDAPREAAFGGVGLLAAMGYWYSRAEETTREQTLAVLDSLEETPLYMVSYNRVSQNQFSHHVIALAKSGNLRGVLNDFYQRARPYSTVSDTFLRRDLPVFRLLYFAFTRFLQLFDAPSFRDFLATRAEYPPSIDCLLGAYLMHAERIPYNIVVAARALGQWVNHIAYVAADAEVPLPDGKKSWKELSEEERKKRDPDVRKLKAKNLVQFESYIMSARGPEEMFARLMRTVGLADGGDAPSAAIPFIDAANIGIDLEFKQAQQLLLAYTRLRANHGEPIGADRQISTTPEDDNDIAPGEEE